MPANLLSLSNYRMKKEFTSPKWPLLKVSTTIASSIDGEIKKVCDQCYHQWWNFAPKNL